MKKPTVLWSLLAVVAVLCVSPDAPAAIFFTETFTYPDGHLASWPPTGGVSGGLWITDGSLASSSPHVDVSNGKISLMQIYSLRGSPPSGENVHRELPALSAGQAIYTGFDLTALTGNATRFFAAFQQGSSFATDCNRLFVTPFIGSDFTFGIGNGYASPTVSWPSGLRFNTTYRVVMSYEFDTGASHLWVNPVNQSSTNISFADTVSTAVSGFALRQNHGPVLPFSFGRQVLDNLIVGTKFDDVLAMPTIPGDFNGDTLVDMADLTQWQGDFGVNGDSDADNDDDSDGVDFLAWQQQFGRGPAVAPAADAVPEPATFVLLIVAAACWCQRRRRTA